MLNLNQYHDMTTALEDACKRYPDNIALIEVDRESELRSITFSMFREEAARIVTSLKKSPLQQDGRIAIIMQNQSKWLISAFSIFRVGAILVPIDYKLTVEEQIIVLKHAQPSILITEYHQWQELHLLLKTQLPTVRVIVTEAPSAAILTGAERFEDQMLLAPDYHIVNKKREDLACIVYSSGTGGVMKGCMMTQNNYLEQARLLSELYPITPASRYFSILPTNHAIDFMCGFILPILFGAAIVHQRTLRPQYLLSTMQQYKITHMALVPMLLKTIAQRIQASIAEQAQWKQWLISFLIKINYWCTKKRPKHALSKLLLASIHKKFGGHLQLTFVGGSFVDESTARFFHQIGIPAVIGYGLTEACTVVTVNELSDLRHDTVGKPLPGVQIKLRNIDKHGVGEVCIKGPTVMAGYFNAPELTQELLSDGWLYTGDIGLIEKTGHLKLIGRSKNMIVTEGGKNVYPEDVEVAFHSMQGCEELAIYAKNYLLKKRDLIDEKLLLVLRVTSSVAKENLIAEIKNRNYQLADYKRISECLIWTDEFPRTASQKIKRDKLADAIAAQIASLELVSVS